MKKLLGALTRFSFLRFAIIGALGAPVDWGVLQLMVHWGTGPYLGRMISWFCAATFTWTGNRYFTFAASRARGFVGAGKEFGLIPCGLGARNTLRLESKMALYGHEISEKINVWEAGLDRYCRLEKGAFIGKNALEAAKAKGLTRTLVGLEMVDRGIARDEYACCNERGEAIGRVTSGSPSPTLCKNIALAYVPPAYAAAGTTIWVEIRTQKCKAQVVPTPFYKRPKKTAVA